MQAKATPIREAVILLPDNDNDTNLERLFSLNDALKEKYGIDAFQTHIHNDEDTLMKTELKNIITTLTLSMTGQTPKEEI